MPLTEAEREELDARARRGETVVPGGKGGKSLRAQEHLAQGRLKGGLTRKQQLGIEGYRELGRSGGKVRKGQLGTKGYSELGSRGGLCNVRNGSNFLHGSASLVQTGESRFLEAYASFAPEDFDFFSATFASPSTGVFHAATRTPTAFTPTPFSVKEEYQSNDAIN